jgi:hypothetical protein
MAQIQLRFSREKIPPLERHLCKRDSLNATHDTQPIKTTLSNAKGVNDGGLLRL